MSPALRERGPIHDAATQLALEHLAESRLRLAGWATQMASRGRASAGTFQPRSETLRMLMSLGLPRLPWIRWGFSALMLWRSLRRR